MCWTPAITSSTVSSTDFPRRISALTPTHPFRAPEKRFDPGKWLLLILTGIFSFALFMRLLQHPTSDISVHTTWAGECTFSDLTTFVRHGAHPMWHVLVTIVTLLGVPLNPASALVTAAVKVIEVWLIHRLLTVALHNHLSRGMISIFAAVCAGVMCLFVPFYNPTVYLGVGSPNTWHSCTQLMAQIFMLVCVPYTAWCYDCFTHRLIAQGQETRLPWMQAIVLGVLVFLSLLAKPTFMQAFLPAACLFFLWQWIRHPKNSRFFVQIILCVLPAVLFMIFQFLYYFGIIVPWQASMVVEASGNKLLDTLIRVVLMIAFPIYTMIACREEKADTTYVLTLVFNAVAIVEFLILGENGRRSADGNFGWGMMGAALMLWVVCLIRFLKAAGWKKSSKRHLIGWILLGWHLFSGVYYVIYLFVTGAAL